MLILQHVAETKIKSIAKSTRKEYRLIPLFMLHFFLWKPKTGKMRGNLLFLFLTYFDFFLNQETKHFKNNKYSFKINLLYFFICFK